MACVIRHQLTKFNAETHLLLLLYVVILSIYCIQIEQDLHYSRMRTARALTVSPSMLQGGVSALGGVCSRGVSALGDVCSGGVCSQGVSAPGGVLQRGVCSGGCLLQGCLLSGGGDCQCS